MNDLIDRQAAIEAFQMFQKYESNRSNSEWVDRIEVVLKNQPTIDAVEIVRCKDCENFTPGKDEWGSCFENPMKMWRDTDYCSWGERKEDATD